MLDKKRELTFRKADKNDAEMIALLADRIWKKHYLPIISVDQIEYMLEKMYSAENLSLQMEQGHSFSIVFIDSLPVGYISLSTKNEKDYFLHKFYIDIDEQSKGIGSRLLSHIIDSIPLAETIELTVNRKNYKAINFYFKNGFSIKEIADFDIGNGFFMNDFIMLKKISR
jgi:ribosomal protein S18 acetylase RimI-like enzyme